MGFGVKLLSSFHDNVHRYFQKRYLYNGEDGRKYSAIRGQIIVFLEKRCAQLLQSIVLSNNEVKK